MNMKEIQEETQNDKTLERLMDIIRTGTWNSVKDPATGEENMNDLKLFAKIRDELTINEQFGIILRGTRIIMP